MNTSDDERPAKRQCLDDASGSMSSGEFALSGRRHSVNSARPRPFHIPRTVSDSYPAFKDKQQCALKIGIQHTFDEEIKKAGFTHLEVGTDVLTVHLHHSQSKLSQQELIDLQKATHFDKKELQQWYKGALALAIEHIVVECSHSHSQAS